MRIMKAHRCIRFENRRRLRHLMRLNLPARFEKRKRREGKIDGEPEKVEEKEERKRKSLVEARAASLFPAKRAKTCVLPRVESASGRRRLQGPLKATLFQLTQRWRFQLLPYSAARRKKIAKRRKSVLCLSRRCVASHRAVRVICCTYDPPRALL